MSEATHYPEPNALARAYRSMLLVLSDRTSLERVAQLVARLSMQLFQASGASVTRLEEGSLLYIGAQGTAANLLNRRLSIEESFTGSVVASAQALIFDPTAAPAWSVARARMDTIRSGMVCPIMLAGQVVGTLGVTSEQERLFTQEDLELLQEFAGFFAVNLERNRDKERLERTMHFYRLGQLASFISRELEAPLASISQTHHELRGVLGKLDGELRSDFDCHLMAAFKEVEDLTRLVSDLRTFATDDGDRAPVEIKPLPVLEKAVNYLKPRVERVALFDFQISGALPSIRAVPGRLWQIVYALVINAIEAIEVNPRGVHEVSLRARELNGWLEIVVRDSGCGIEQEDMGEIFEPFFSTKRGQRRAGLGLTLVWRYVDALGGRVQVESKPGEGSAFTLMIPGRATRRGTYV